VIRPPGAQTWLLLARADGPEQRAAVGHQAAGRVGCFLRVDDFDAAHAKVTADGVEFVTDPRTEPYGRVAVFRDIAVTAATCSGRRNPASGPMARKHGLVAAAPPTQPYADGSTAWRADFARTGAPRGAAPPHAATLQGQL
jgi:hypothetical protein